MLPLMMMMKFHLGKHFTKINTILFLFLYVRTFGPPIESPHPVRYYVGKPFQTFKAPFLTVESVYEASQSYTTQTISVFNGFFGTSEFSSGAATNTISAAFILAVVALVF